MKPLVVPVPRAWLPRPVALSALRRIRWDPRLYQIATLGGPPRLRRPRGSISTSSRRRAAVILATVLAAQYVGTRASAAARVRSPERAHLGPVPVPPAAHQLRSRWPSSPPSLAIASKFVLRVRGQARLQPDELRARGHDAPDRRGLGLAGPVGQRRLLRLPARLRRRARREPRRAERRDLRLPGRPRGPRLRAVAVAGRAAGDPAPPARRTARCCSSPSS